MKKLIASVLVALAGAAWAIDYQTQEVDGCTWTYYVDGDNAILDNNSACVASPAPTGLIAIPETLGGKPVTTIGANAFKDCDLLAGVAIHSGVETIRASAFEGCVALDYLTVPDSVTTIGDNAFKGCAGLNFAVLPGKFSTEITRIFDTTSAAITCIDGVKVDVVNGVGFAYTVSGDNAILGGGAWNLAIHKGTTGTVEIPETLGGYPVTTIGDYAFYDCSAIDSVIIPDSVTTIEQLAFYSCTMLASVEIGDGVETIGDNAFNSCAGLMSVEIPDSVTTIGTGAFANSWNLTDVAIGDGVTTIGAGAFMSCSGLERVTIGEGLATIGYDAFQYCGSPRTVRIHVPPPFSPLE